MEYYDASKKYIYERLCNFYLILSKYKTEDIFYNKVTSKTMTAYSLI